MLKNRLSRGVMTALLLCAVLSAFYLRAVSVRPMSSIPVERVFAQVSPTQTPPGERQRRDDQRDREMNALSALAATDEGAAEALRELVERAENELAVESALSALGIENAMCSLRAGAAAICVKERLDADTAGKIIALCASIAGIETENVFVLDECAYL